MQPPAIPMIDPFTRTRFRTDLRLEAWYPEGLLDVTLATFIIHYVGFEESIADEPFHRYADLSKLTAVHLVFKDIADLVAIRRASYDGREPVKSAIFAPNAPAYGLAHMFAALMEPSPIDVRVFREVAEAAEWLGVRVEALAAEP
ncbi:MAG: hypothetical protein V4689_10860 [Verrucomicrobiota bacterium]